MTNDEGMTKSTKINLAEISSFEHSDFLRHSSFSPTDEIAVAIVLRHSSIARHLINRIATARVAVS
jgi:hypothetical protein